MSDPRPLPVAIIPTTQTHTQPSSALIRVGNLQVIANRPSIYIDEAFSAGAKHVEAFFRVLAQIRDLGPVTATERAVLILGDSTSRLSNLDELYSFRQDSTNSVISKKVPEAVLKLSSECRKLLKYARRYVWSDDISDIQALTHQFSSELPETQLLAFRSIVMLTTRYLGLRWLFIEHLKSDSAPRPSQSDLSNLWRKDRTAYVDREWDFFLKYAAYCVSAPDDSVTGIAETYKPSDLGLVRHCGSLCVSDILANWIFKCVSFFFSLLNHIF